MPLVHATDFCLNRQTPLMSQLEVISGQPRTVSLHSPASLFSGWTALGYFGSFHSICSPWLVTTQARQLHNWLSMPFIGVISQRSSVCRYDHLFARVSEYLPQTESSTSDNASNNGTMNAALCKKIHRVVGSRLSPEDIQIGCGVHVTHLTVQYVLLFLFGPVH